MMSADRGFTTQEEATTTHGCKRNTNCSYDSGLEMYGIFFSRRVNLIGGEFLIHETNWFFGSAVHD
jgi:hypothetical protein